jgi:hypothetical protein
VLHPGCVRHVVRADWNERWHASVAYLSRSHRRWKSAPGTRWLGRLKEVREKARANSRENRRVSRAGESWDRHLRRPRFRGASTVDSGRAICNRSCEFPGLSRATGGAGPAPVVREPPFRAHDHEQPGHRLTFRLRAAARPVRHRAHSLTSGAPATLNLYVQAMRNLASNHPGTRLRRICAVQRPSAAALPCLAWGRSACHGVAADPRAALSVAETPAIRPRGDRRAHRRTMGCLQ